MSYAAFAGRVIFECTPPNMKTIIVEEAMFRAVPEARDFPVDSPQGKLFYNLIHFLGRTKSITVDNPDGDYVIASLADFWAFVRVNSDYRAIWDCFIMLDVMVNSEWNAALEDTEDKHLKAPELVQPGAPSDGLLEAAAEAGKKKSKNGTPTSKPSMTAPAPSSPRAEGAIR
jgi:hypothetical protein